MTTSAKSKAEYRTPAMECGQAEPAILCDSLVDSDLPDITEDDWTL